MKVKNGVLIRVAKKDLALLQTNPNEFWKDIEEIGDYAFCFLNKLEQLTIPSTVKKIGKNAIYACKNLQAIRCDGELQFEDLHCLTLFKFLRREDDFFVIDKVQQNLSDLPINDAFAVKLFRQFHNVKEIRQALTDPIKIEFFVDLYNAVSDEEFTKIMPTLNFSHFNRLAQKFHWSKTSWSSQNSLLLKLRFFYNMGGLSKPINTTRISKSGNKIEEKVDYAQKVCEFFYDQLEQYLDEKHIEVWGQHMNLEGLKPEFSNFLIKESNFLEMTELAYENDFFIPECYNNFYEIQKSNTSNKGSQRQLAPTSEHFFKYFKRKIAPSAFLGHEELVDTVTDYFFDIETVKLAIAIDEKRKKSNVNNHILSGPLKEDAYSSKLENLDALIDKCEKVNAASMKSMVNIANKKFTYEWLDKSAPENFILGKLCNCCAHLQGAGAGIMEKSILYPNVQNLVMRNKNNEIIAKATMYINTNEQYAVFNNAEVADKVSPLDRGDVYKAFMRGVYAFIKQYNNENPTKELKIVTIGMSGLNDLRADFETYNEKSKIIYASIDYSNPYMRWSHRGDSNDKQYVLYEKDNSYYEELEKTF